MLKVQPPLYLCENFVSKQHLKLASQSNMDKYNFSCLNRPIKVKSFSCGSPILTKRERLG